MIQRAVNDGNSIGIADLGEGTDSFGSYVGIVRPLNGFDQCRHRSLRADLTKNMRCHKPSIRKLMIKGADQLRLVVGGVLGGEIHAAEWATRIATRHLTPAARAKPGLHCLSPGLPPFQQLDRKLPAGKPVPPRHLGHDLRSQRSRLSASSGRVRLTALMRSCRSAVSESFQPEAPAT
jgi:hypothetical protein